MLRNSECFLFGQQIKVVILQDFGKGRDIKAFHLEIQTKSSALLQDPQQPLA